MLARFEEEEAKIHKHKKDDSKDALTQEQIMQRKKKINNVNCEEMADFLAKFEEIEGIVSSTSN